MNLQKNLEKLISFKTVTGNYQECERAFSWIKKELKGLPLYFSELKFNSFPALLITTKKTKTPNIWLVAHIDVVDAEKKLFKPTVKRGKLYGRGAYDMKFAVAIYMQLLNDLRNELNKYNLGVMLTSDEEIGGANGVPKILQKGYKSKVCFLPDGAEYKKIDTAVKGVWHLKVKSYGKPVHASRPWLGINAINELTNFLRESQEMIFKKKNKDHWHNTMVIGKINGGRATNYVADYAESLVDVRFISEKDYQKIKNSFNETAKKYHKIKIESVIKADAFISDFNNKYVKLYRDVAKKIGKFEYKPTVSHGSSDARFFSAKNIPTIVTYPKGGGHHTNNEWIDLEELKKLYSIIKKYVENCAKS